MSNKQKKVSGSERIKEKKINELQGFWASSLINTNPWKMSFHLGLTRNRNSSLLSTYMIASYMSQDDLIAPVASPH